MTIILEIGDIPFRAPGAVGRTMELAQNLDSVRVRQTAWETFQDLGPKLSDTLRQQTPTGVTARLRASTTYNILDLPEAVQLQLRQPAISRKVAGQRSRPRHYLPFVVAGRGPGKRPPKAALVPWVTAKWGLRGAAARRAGFRLAKRIGRFGTRPHPYTEDVIAQETGTINAAAIAIGRKLRVEILHRG